MGIPKAKFKVGQKVIVDSVSSPKLNGEHEIMDRQYVSTGCTRRGNAYTGWIYRIETDDWGSEKAFSAVS